MLTPWLIQVMFWLGTLGCLVAGGRMMVGSFREREVREESPTDGWGDRRWGSPAASPKYRKETGFDAYLFGYGLATATVGPIVLRIWAEMTIILFSIHIELKRANDRRE